jgi:hypothetical protein
MITGELAKGQKVYICRCIVYFDREAKTEHDKPNKYVFRKRKTLDVIVCFRL